MSFLLSFAHGFNLFYFISSSFFGLIWFCLFVCMCVYIFHYFFFSIFLIFYLPFVWGLHFVSCFNVYVLVPFNAIRDHLWNLSSLARDWALNLWSRSANNKTLECQKTSNPRVY